MALRLGALYDALRQGQGITVLDARRAAEEVAEGQLAHVEASLHTLRLLVRVVGTLALINLVATLAVLVRLGGR